MEWERDDILLLTQMDAVAHYLDAGNSHFVSRHRQLGGRKTPVPCASAAQGKHKPIKALY